jgi:uncharacterized protein (DUF2252 family)
MLVSPFMFYRGAALIMASDLAATPRSGLTVQCCGDAHPSNFGVFASHERRLMFDLNDFESVDGRVRIVDQSPLIVPIDKLVSGGEHDEMYERLRQLFRGYRETLEFDRRLLLEQFELADSARKVVGVGSVGTRAWIALMLGRDGQDPLFLQMKEAEASVLEEFLGASEFSNHGERVVAGQRLMQASSDIFLGWLHVESGIDGQARDFYGRQLKDWKGSAEIEQMIPKGLAIYGKLCGWTLARAHARSGDRVAIAAYLGHGASFDRAILEFSNAYAEQNERDYEA